MIDDHTERTAKTGAGRRGVEAVRQWVGEKIDAIWWEMGEEVGDSGLEMGDGTPGPPFIQDIITVRIISEHNMSQCSHNNIRPATVVSKET